MTDAKEGQGLPPHRGHWCLMGLHNRCPGWSRDTVGQGANPDAILPLPRCDCTCHAQPKLPL